MSDVETVHLKYFVANILTIIMQRTGKRKNFSNRFGKQKKYQTQILLELCELIV